MRIGSREHRDLFCRTFIETHVAYDPLALTWPQLDEDVLGRLRAIPLWGTALQIERDAGFLITRFAETFDDALIREAVMLQGYEEDRHAKMIGTLVQRYGLTAQPPGPLPQPTRGAFISFGYNECLDSFLGFGVHRLASQARVLPDELISLFTQVLHEEARHIVFFRQLDRVRSRPARRTAAAPSARGCAGIFALTGAAHEARDGASIQRAGTGVRPDIQPVKFFRSRFARLARRMFARQRRGDGCFRSPPAAPARRPRHRATAACASSVTGRARYYANCVACRRAYAPPLASSVSCEPISTTRPPSI